MIRSVVLASAICFAFVVPAAAQTAELNCDEATLTKMRGEIDAMTDKEKQKASMDNWEAANTAFKAQDLKTCLDRLTNNQADKSGDQPAAQ